MNTKRISITVCILAVCIIFALSGTTLADRVKPWPTLSRGITPQILVARATPQPQPTESVAITSNVVARQGGDPVNPNVPGTANYATTGLVEQMGVLVADYRPEEVTYTHVVFPAPFADPPLVQVFFPSEPGLSLIEEGIVISPSRVGNFGFDIAVMRQQRQTAGVTIVAWRAIGIKGIY